MSIQQQRVKSAGVGRGTILTGDVKLLQNAAVQLQQQLLNSKAENQKIKDQLNCLISLVRRAWTGDNSAVVHVANIVGVAPPDLRQDTEDENHFVVVAQPKSRAVNNWARLTIGLLNRQYCYLEREIEEEQKRQLLDRCAYLDGQVEQKYVPAHQEDPWDILPKRGVTHPTPHDPHQNFKERAGSAKKKPTMRHLYRPANQKAEQGHDPRLTWGDIIPDHVNNKTNEQDSLLYKMSNGHGSVGSGDPYSRQYSDYTNPRRYSSSGLFDEETALGQDAVNRRRRPTSGKEQKQNDLLRARPKSSVLPKGERPLKYETTRPVSSKPRSMKTDMRTSSAGDLYNTNKRPTSGKQVKSHTFITNGHMGHEEQHVNDLHLDLGDLSNATKAPNGAVSDTDSWDSEAEEREKRHKEVEEILVKIRRPESLVQYEQSLNKQGQLEEDFRNQTISLQKKLGISPGGRIE